MVSRFLLAAPRWISARIFGLLAAVLIFAAVPRASAVPVSAQVGSTVIVGDFSVVVDSFIPPGASRGFAPVRVRATNEAFQPESLRVSKWGYSSNMASATQDVSLVLEAGETRAFELLIPLDREDGNANLIIGLRNRDDSQNVRIPLCSERASSSGRVIGFLGVDELSKVQLSALSTALPLDRGETIRGAFDQAFRRGGRGDQGAQLFTLALDDLPSWTAGWSSVDTLFVDVDSELPADPRWERILEWTRQGGQLVFVGSDLGERLKSIPGLAEMTTPRLLAAPSAKAWGIAGQFGGELSAYRAGLGWIVQHTVETEGLPFLLSSRVPPDDYIQWTGLLKVLDQLADSGSAAPSVLELVSRASYVGSGPRWAMDFPDGGLPIRPVLGILTLFALLVGPGSLIYSRRKSRPGILLVAVPLLSVVTTGVIVGYGVLRQGFGTEGYAHSLAVVDQVQQQATAMLRREMILGRGGQRLQPLPSTAVFVPDEGEQGRERVVEMDGNQLILSGDFLPVRERTTHLAVSTTTTRAHLDWSTPDGNTMKVTNVLGVDLGALSLRAPDGRIYSTESTIAQGDTATLTFGGEPDIDRLFHFGSQDPIFRSARLPRCGYVATAAAPGPGVDDCSVEMDELYGFHGIVGYLDPDSDQWGL